MEEKIASIIADCEKLNADEDMKIFNFGVNSDLTLYIHKDCDYNTKTDEYNLVTISTKKNDNWVDDTEGVFVNDGSLYKELERIYNYRDFTTL